MSMQQYMKHGTFCPCLYDPSLPYRKPSRLLSWLRQPVALPRLSLPKLPALRLA